MRKLTALLLLMLVACGGPTPEPGPPLPEPVDRNAPGFSVLLTPMITPLSIDESIDVTVRVTRSGGFSEPITVQPAAGAEIPAGLQLGSASLLPGTETAALRVAADDRLPPGSHHVTLRATGGDVVRTVSLRVDVKAPFPRIDSVDFENSTGNQVRQGAGEVVLRLRGQHFARVTDFELAGLDVEVLPGRSDTEVSLGLTVDHGLAVGERNLRFSTETYGGSELTGAIQITPITVGPAGSDADGHGTMAHPYRSLTMALSVAGGSDTVHLLNGNYNAANGENWGTQDWPSTQLPMTLPTPNVPADVSIRGQSSAGVILEGNYAAGGTETGLVFASASSLSGVTLVNFTTAIITMEGEQELTDLALEENSEGILVLDEAVTTVVQSVLQRTVHQAIRAENSSSVSLRNVDISDGGFVSLEARGSSHLAGEQVTISRSGGDGVRISDSATAELRRLTVQGSGGDGIAFRGQGLSLRSSVITDNGGSGVLVGQEPHYVDLGTILEPGENTLEGNGGYQLLDERPGRSDLFGVPITVSSSSLAGETWSGRTESGPVEIPGVLSIQGLNQRIEFH